MATFELSGKKIFVIVVLSIVLAVLLFLTGWQAGSRRGRTAVEETPAELGAAPAAGAPRVGGARAPTLSGGAAPRLGGAQTPSVSGPRAPTLSGPRAPTLSGPRAPRLGGGTAARAAAAAASAAEPAAGEPEPEVAAAPAGFTLCVGSFLIAEDADLFVAEIGERGYEPWIEKIRDPEQRQIHRVMVGGWETYPEAERAATVFAAKESLEAIVVRIRQEEREI